MRAILRDIQDGTFARRWIAESESGQSDFLEYRDQDRRHQVEAVGADLRSRMAWLDHKTAPGMEHAVAAQEEKV
jgi:ketol-acid reductoisomerase